MTFAFPVIYIIFILMFFYRRSSIKAIANVRQRNWQIAVSFSNNYFYPFSLFTDVHPSGIDYGNEHFLLYTLCHHATFFNQQSGHPCGILC